MISIDSKSMDRLNHKNYYYQISTSLQMDSGCDDSVSTNSFVKINKKYNLYSRTSKLVDDKIDETIFLLYSNILHNNSSLIFEINFNSFEIIIRYD